MDQLEPPLGNDDVMESWHASPRFQHDFKYAVITAHRLCILKIDMDTEGEQFLQDLQNMESLFLQHCWTCEKIVPSASKIKVCKFSQEVIKSKSFTFFIL